MILLTMSPPAAGMIINDGGDRYVVVRVRSFSGTVADLEVRPTDSGADR